MNRSIRSLTLPVTVMVMLTTWWTLAGFAAASERKVITIAGWGTADAEFEDEVEAQFPNIDLQQLMFESDGDMREKVIAMAVGGASPDLWGSNPDMAVHFYNAGVTVDLTPIIERDPDFKLDDYFPAAVEDYRIGGAQVGFPTHFQITGIWYNMDLFDKAGLVYPGGEWTWEDYRQMAQSLTVRPNGGMEPTQWGTLHPMGAQFWMPWIYSSGGSIVDDLDSPTQSTVQSSETLNALEFLRTLVVEDQVVGPLRGPGAGGAFFDGLVGMYPYYAVAGRVTSLGQSFRYNVANIPAGPAGAVNAMLPGGYVVGKTGQAEEAWKIIKWIAETGRNTTNAIPSYIPFAKTDQWPNVEPPVPPDYHRAAWVEGALLAQPQVINHPRVFDIFTEVGRFREAIEGNESLRAVAESVADVIDGYLSE